MERLRRLKVILRGHDLVDYTWWAGEVIKRIPESARLHKQPQKDNTCVTFDSSCPDGMCLIEGSKYFFAFLMKSGYAITSNPTKFDLPPFRYPKNVTFTPADALKYLMVLLADMHYPFNLDLDEPYSVAHKKVDVSAYPMWESLCMEKLGHAQPTLEEFISIVFMPHYIHKNEDSWYGAWTNVEVLGSRYKVEQESFNRNTWDNFEIWATETANLNCAMIITRNDYKDDPNKIILSDSLMERLGLLVRFQIVLAGARIAIVMNYILSHREIAYCAKTGLLIEKNPNDRWSMDDIWFSALILAFCGICAAGAYVLFLVVRSIYKRNFKTHVDQALQGWRDRRKKKYTPHLDLHDD
ncbi:hypothetical protein BOVATA_038530 [Babesia ovata]|uniref:Uncharacterized protein n=1 Tax=Babesia ovata TaxID=189622 RepID=A0A2H6KH92_9APIC|nr:uncharacterized protein BOVATA_038530 [Babesia ovata]GBE62360.1 hypothetical protein BOVATA_038530 [Babesia ovata]